MGDDEHSWGKISLNQNITLSDRKLQQWVGVGIKSTRKSNNGKPIQKAILVNIRCNISRPGA